jgi:hypothetical protein
MAGRRLTLRYERNANPSRSLELVRGFALPAGGWDGHDDKCEQG